MSRLLLDTTVKRFGLTQWGASHEADPYENVASKSGSGCRACGSRLSESSLHLVRHALSSPAEALPPQTRARMEPYFGQDLSNVRVHTRPEAADSARAVSADAYTLGRDIVFGPGKYAPHTLGGERLLAHELTHTFQQSAPSADSNQLSIAPSDSPAEREAERASLGLAAPKRFSATPGDALQRSVAGDIAGGTIGAGAGAGLGALAGGPVGGVVGGLLGGLVGLALGDALSADKRGLTDGEKTEARRVFGSSLNHGDVVLADATIFSRIISGRALAVTPLQTIYFPSGQLQKDYSSSSDYNAGMPLLIHELTHCWQTQHGVSVLEKVFTAAHGRSAYPYSPDEMKTKKSFSEFNTEQQGDIMRDYYVKLSNPDFKADHPLELYEPFVAEVQGGNLGAFNRNISGPAPAYERNDRNLIGPAATSAEA